MNPSEDRLHYKPGAAGAVDAIGTKVTVNSCLKDLSKFTQSLIVLSLKTIATILNLIPIIKISR